MSLQQVWRAISSQNSYFLRARLDGHRGPINCFAIIGDAELLASGGDDECVNIWDLQTLKRSETLTNPGGHWGQITCLIWINLTNNLPGNGLLCLGTGRGRFAVYRRRKRSQFVEVCDTQIFNHGNSVEALAFDATHHRLVATSHNGSFKMFRLDKDGVLSTALWTVEHTEAIPRSVHFLNRGEDIVIYSLESGECLGNPFRQVMTHGSTSSLIQAVACASSDERHLIISGSSDNKSDICVWEKPTKRVQERRMYQDQRRGELILILILVIANTLHEVANLPLRFKIVFGNLGTPTHDTIRSRYQRTLNEIEYAEKLDDALLERLDDQMWRKFLKMGPELVEKDREFPDNKDESQTGVDRQLAIEAFYTSHQQLSDYGIYIPHSKDFFLGEEVFTLPNMPFLPSPVPPREPLPETPSPASLVNLVWADDRYPFIPWMFDSPFFGPLMCRFSTFGYPAGGQPWMAPPARHWQTMEGL
ncbi:WD40-repeat-containing domain protein [Flammula alnicola]|nr:WD40-repeat-containing domain protein [Flammula alnicola]